MEKNATTADEPTVTTNEPIATTKEPIINTSSRDKLILLLDIDNTLICHKRFSSTSEAQEYVEAMPKNDTTGQPVEYIQPVLKDDLAVQINLRPGLTEFLQNVAGCCEVHLFTAGKQGYAEAVAETLDPEGKYFSNNRMWSQDHVQWGKGKECYWKDLSKLPLGRSDLSRVVLVDDSVDHLVANPSNVICIEEFEDEPNDGELERVWKIIHEELKDVDDIRPILEKKGKGKLEMRAIWQTIFPQNFVGMFSRRQVL